MAGFFESIGKAVADNVDVEALGEKVWNKIWVWAEPKLDETVDKYTPIIMEKLMAMMPTLAATVAKTVADQIVAVMGKALASDPDIPIVSDIFDLSETVRNAINGDPNIPFHIPVLGDILGGLGRH